MSIQISEAFLEQIRRAGEAAFPDEGCGFLLGRAAGAGREVKALQAAENARDESERRNRYTITPEAFLAAEKLARRDGLDIIGFYHSHPNAPARPSGYDTDHAWPWYTYMIVSVLNGRAGPITAWVLQDDRQQFIEEDVQLG
jgi:proteasome lid subunit RPN8/RPN11